MEAAVYTHEREDFPLLHPVFSALLEEVIVRVYNILESTGLEAIVVNVQHMKAVPGRKTDVKDAEWIADLLQHGLLKASFIPDKAHR